MLVSSVLNSITFKSLAGSYPSRANRLHNDYTRAGVTTIKYYQKFNNSDIIPLQFSSDSEIVPQLISFNEANEVIAYIPGTLVSSYTGATNRYYFNFSVVLDYKYSDQKVRFEIRQGSDYLNSEPICVSDISEEIETGTIKKIQYANYDVNGFADSYFTDWSVLDFMFFYVHSSESYRPEGTIDVLDDVNYKTNIAAKLFAAIEIKTDPIPDYLAEKMIAASMLDLFTINDVQYIASEVGDKEQFGKSSLYQLTLNLTEKSTVGLNADDILIQKQINNQDVIQVKKNQNVTGSGWQVENPAGYMLHSIQIKHNNTSAADLAVVKCGTVIGGNDIIDEFQGEIERSEYSNKFKNYPIHFLKTENAPYNLYFNVSGAGSDLTIICNFDTITPSI